MTAPLVRLLALLIAVQGIGSAVLILSGAAYVIPSRIGRACYSFLLGTGLVSLVWFTVSWFLGAQLTFQAALLPWIPVVFLAWRRAQKTSPDAPHRVTRGSWLSTGLQLLIVVNLAAVLTAALINPVWAPDGLARWMLKAKMLLDAGSAQTDLFADPSLGFTLPRSPAGISFQVALVWKAWGFDAGTNAFDDFAGKLLFPVYFAALLGVLYQLVRPVAGRMPALTLTALLSGVPAVAYLAELFYVDVAPGGEHLYTLWPGACASLAMADVPLAALILAAGGSIARWVEHREKSDRILAALFLGLAAWTKDEGVAFLMLGCTWLVVDAFTRKDDLSGRAAALLTAGTAILMAFPWQVAAAEVPANVWDPDMRSLLYPDALGTGAEVATRFAQHAGAVASRAGWEMVRLSHWNMVWVVAALALVLAPRHAMRRPAGSLLVLGVGQLTLYFLILSVSPWQDFEEKMSATVPRLLIHVAPLALLFVGYQINAILGASLGRGTVLVGTLSMAFAYLGYRDFVTARPQEPGHVPAIAADAARYLDLPADSRAATWRSDHYRAQVRRRRAHEFHSRVDTVRSLPLRSTILFQGPQAEFLRVPYHLFPRSVVQVPANADLEGVERAGVMRWTPDGWELFR